MTSQPAPRARILVVDDESSVRVLLNSILSRAGYEVVTCETAEAGLASLHRAPAQLVIVDRVLPGMDGIEFFRQARRDFPQLQGILISAYPSGDVKARAMEAGLRDYVVKPFQVSDILAVCEAAMKMVPS